MTETTENVQGCTHTGCILSGSKRVYAVKIRETMENSISNIPSRTWGRWYLDSDPPVSLNINLKPWYVYDIALDRCQTEHARDIWMNHMAQKKALVTRKDVADLKRAFSDLVASGLIPTEVKK